MGSNDNGSRNLESNTAGDDAANDPTGVLRAGGGLAAFGTAIGLAGCLGGILGIGADDRPDAIDTVRKWSPPPA